MLISLVFKTLCDCVLRNLLPQTLRSRIKLRSILWTIILLSYQCIFTCEKHIHIADDPVVYNNEESEGEEGGVLQSDVHHYRAHVD